MTTVAIKRPRKQGLEVYITSTQRAERVMNYLVNTASCSLKKVPGLCCDEFKYYQLKRRGRRIGAVTYNANGISTIFIG